MATLKSQLQQLNQTLKERQRTIRSLEAAKNESDRVWMAEIQKIVNEVTKDKTATKQHVTELEDGIRQRDQRLLHLEQEHKLSSIKTADEAERLRRGHDMKIRRLEKEVTRRDERLRGLEADLKTVHAVVIERERERDGLAEKLERLLDRQRISTAGAEATKRSANEASQRLNATTIAMAEIQHKLTMTERQRDDLEHNLTTLKVARARDESDRKQLETDRVRREQKMTTEFESEINRLRTALAETSSSSSASSSEDAKAVTAAESLQREHREAVDRCRSLTIERDDMLTKLQATQSLLRELEVAGKAAAHDRSQSERQFVDLRSQFGTATSRLNELETERLRLAKTCDDLNTSIAEEREKNGVKSLEIGALKSEITRFQTAIANAAPTSSAGLVSGTSTPLRASPLPPEFRTPTKERGTSSNSVPPSPQSTLLAPAGEDMKAEMASLSATIQSQRETIDSLQSTVLKMENVITQMTTDLERGRPLLRPALEQKATSPTASHSRSTSMSGWAGLALDEDRRRVFVQLHQVCCPESVRSAIDIGVRLLPGCASHVRSCRRSTLSVARSRICAHKTSNRTSKFSLSINSRRTVLFPSLAYPTHHDSLLISLEKCSLFSFVCPVRCVRIMRVHWRITIWRWPNVSNAKWRPVPRLSPPYWPKPKCCRHRPLHRALFLARSTPSPPRM